MFEGELRPDTKKLEGFENPESLEQVERISSNLVAGLKEKDELVQSLKVEREKNKEMLRPFSSSRIISKDKLPKVTEIFRVSIKRCLEKHSKLELVNGILECSVCRDDWSVAGLATQPKYQFQISRATSSSVERHWEKSRTHSTCSVARDKFNGRNDFYRRSIRLARDETNVMTENIFRTVYFLLHNDLPMYLFESLIELLDSRLF